MGRTKLFKSKKNKALFAHSMRHYIDIIKEDDKFKVIPEKWAG
jgi:hypothetical protein